MKQCGPLVTLQVLKDAANRQGLSALLAKPSENHLHHHQQPQQQQLARFPATSNPSLLSHQHPPIPSSTMPLKSTSSHERLLTHNNGHHHHHHQQSHQQQQHFATLAHPPHHQMPPPALTQPRPASRSQLPNPSSSYEFVYNAKSVPISNNNHHSQQQQQQRFSQPENSHRLIQPARSAQALIDEEMHDDFVNEHTIQHQSNPNLFHNNQIPYPMINNRNQTFDIPKRTYPHENHLLNGNDHHDLYEQEYNGEGGGGGEEEEDGEDDDDDLPPTNFVRSASERQSFGDRNLSTAPPLIFREDVPHNQNGYTNGNHQIKPINHTQSAIGPAIAPKPLPKPMISALALIKQTNSVISNSQISKSFVFSLFRRMRMMLLVDCPKSVCRLHPIICLHLHGKFCHSFFHNDRLDSYLSSKKTD